MMMMYRVGSQEKEEGWSVSGDDGWCSCRWSVRIREDGTSAASRSIFLGKVKVVPRCGGMHGEKILWWWTNLLSYR